MTQRRWLLKSNPLLAELLRSTIGDGWITNLDKLRALEPYAPDRGLQRTFLDVKHANKERLAKMMQETTQILVDPHTLFDIHVKRIHEYKRQLLNVMRIMHEYLRLVEDQVEPTVPRTYVFAGKAAPGYWAAKQIIKLINNVSQVINNDARVRGQIKVVFIPDYRVLLAEKIIPAADLSEHISMAGTEASGTSNMKFAMNGALTIGTLDGANIEIMEEVGKENIFIFGLKAQEIQELRRHGGYDPREYYRRYPEIRRVVDTFTWPICCPISTPNTPLVRSLSAPWSGLTRRSSTSRALANSPAIAPCRSMPGTSGISSGAERLSQQADVPSPSGRRRGGEGVRVLNPALPVP